MHYKSGISIISSLRMIRSLMAHNEKRSIDKMTESLIDKVQWNWRVYCAHKRSSILLWLGMKWCIPKKGMDPLNHNDIWTIFILEHHLLVIVLCMYMDITCLNTFKLNAVEVLQLTVLRKKTDESIRLLRRHPDYYWELSQLCTQ